MIGSKSLQLVPHIPDLNLFSVFLLICIRLIVRLVFLHPLIQFVLLALILDVLARFPVGQGAKSEKPGRIKGNDGGNY